MIDSKANLGTTGEADDCLFEYLHAELINYVLSKSSSSTGKSHETRMQVAKEDTSEPINYSSKRPHSLSITSRTHVDRYEHHYLPSSSSTRQQQYTDNNNSNK